MTIPSAPPIQRQGGPSRRPARAIGLGIAASVVLIGLALMMPRPAGSALIGPSAFGSAVGADSLANSPVGGPFENDVAYRFRATETSALESITIYIVTGPGYSDGTGGTMRISVHEDDGSSSHLPSDRILAALDVVPREGAGLTYWFPDPPMLTAGELYHVVFTNTDASPSANFVSVNGLFLFGDERARQPSLSRTDWANLVRPAGSWWSDVRPPGRGTITPIMGLRYANGETAGLGYMEVWVDEAKPISGENRVRQVFTVQGADRLVHSASVRLERISGSGPLIVELRSDGEVVGAGEVPAECIAIADSDANYGSSWATLWFEEPLTLRSGETYRLVLGASPADEYQAHAVRKGSAYGYPSGSYFGLGRAEYRDGSSWQPFTAWGLQIAQGDLQFFLKSTSVDDVHDVSESRTDDVCAPLPDPTASMGPSVAIATAEPSPAPRMLEPEDDRQAMCQETPGATDSGEGAPVVSDVRRDGSSSVVEWNVDPPATGQVAYGRSDVADWEYVTTFEPALLDYHSQIVPSPGQPELDLASDYRFRVCAFSEDGHTITHDY